MAYNVGAGKDTWIPYAPKSGSRRKKELNANGKPLVCSRRGNVMGNRLGKTLHHDAVVLGHTMVVSSCNLDNQ